MHETRMRLADVPPERRFGKFACTQKLGAGAMGEVWKAADTELARVVALKLLKGGDDEEIARFKREAQVAGKLSHPHIAAIYEVGHDNGRHFIAMQFIDGQTLKTFPREDPSGTPGAGRRLLVRLLRDVASALAYAHERGVVHRDLKPENIMVTSTGGSSHVYVTDFGLARAHEGRSELSRSGLVVGTPAYMAPEQARGERVDPRADVYSLGATLYELLSDRPPFAGPTIISILEKVQNEEPKPLAGRARVDRDLETIVFKCLEKEPERRYASAGELAEDLTRWLEGDEILARPASTWYRIRKQVRKRRGVFAASLLGLAAVTATAAVFVPRWLGERARAEEEARGKSRAEELQRTMQELNRHWAQVQTAREWTRQHFRKPEEILQAFDAALKELDVFVDRHPTLPQAWYVRARVRAFLSDLEGAEDDARRAVSFDPDFSPAWALIGHVLLERSWETLLTDTTGRYRPPEQARPSIEAAADALRRATSFDPARWGLTRTRDDDVAVTIVAALRREFIDRDPQGAKEILERAQKESPSEEYCRLLHFHARNLERLEWLRKSFTIAPHNARTHVDHGNLMMSLREYREALESYRRATRINPRDPVAHYNTGIALAQLGETGEAAAAYTRALELKPRFTPAWNNRGNARRKLGDAAGAFDDFTQAIAVDPAYWSAYTNRGILHAEAGRLAEALADHTRAIAINPNLAAAYVNRGNVHLDQGDRAAARQDYAKAIEVDPGEAAGWFGRGRLRALEGDIDGAYDDYSRAIEADPRHGESYNNRGNLRDARGDFDGAIADYTEAIAIDPASAKRWHNRGALRAKKRDWAAAIADYTQALELHPDLPGTHLARGRAYLMKGDPAAALPDLDRAIELAPTDPGAWSARGLARENSGNVDGAIEDYTRVLELKPDSVEAWNNRSGAHRAKKNWKQAIEDADSGLAIQPRSPELHANRGMAKYSSGDRSGALDDFERALELAPPDWPQRRPLQQWVDQLKR